MYLLKINLKILNLEILGAAQPKFSKFKFWRTKTAQFSHPERDLRNKSKKQRENKVSSRALRPKFDTLWGTFGSNWYPLRDLFLQTLQKRHHVWEFYSETWKDTRDYDGWKNIHFWAARPHHSIYWSAPPPGGSVVSFLKQWQNTVSNDLFRFSWSNISKFGKL